MTENLVIILSNGVEMPALGLGVYQSNAEDTARAVRVALETGYRLIDTASAYFNEAEVGQGIRDAGLPHDDIFVTTKLWMSDYGYDEALHGFDRSMGKLGLECLDLYLLHWPVSTEFDRTVQSWKAAERLLEEGRTRAIGVCNFSAADLDALTERGEIVPAVNQVELHPFFSQPGLREADRRLEIVTQAWSPIGGINRYTDGHSDPLADPVMTDLAQKYGKTPAQVVLRWQIQIGNSAIPKSVNPGRITENFAIFDFALTGDEIAAIEALDTAIRSGPDPQHVNQDMFGLRVED